MVRWHADAQEPQAVPRTTGAAAVSRAPLHEPRAGSYPSERKAQLRTRVRFQPNTRRAARGRPVEWRRRESNPRPQPHRLSVYKRRLPFRFARRPGCSRPTDGLAILQRRAPGDWLSLGAEPVRWRLVRATGPTRGGVATLGRYLGGECEITRIRTCVCAG